MKRKIISTLFALVLLVGLSLMPAAPAGAADPQFLHVVPYEVTTGEWSKTVEATTPQSGTYSYHVVLPADSSGVGLDIIHKYIYGPSGVGTMTLADITDMTFGEYVKVAGGTDELGAGITLYIDMNDDGDFDWVNDAQIVLESPYNSPLVTENIGEWVLRDITDFAGFQKGSGSINDPYTGVDGVALHCTLAEWQASGYATKVVLWVGIVAGWGDYGDYDGYFDDFIINGETYDLEQPAEVWVDDTGDDANPGTETEPFLTIQYAIDILADGTVNVAEGTYEESILIDKALTIVGAQAGVDPTVEGARIVPAEESTIDAAGTGKSVIYIDANNVTIDGFTVKNAEWSAAAGGNGIVVLPARSLATIINNIAEANSLNGIDLFTTSHHNTARNNITRGHQHSGIVALGSHSNTIENNISKSNDCGISLWSTDWNEVGIVPERDFETDPSFTANNTVRNNIVDLNNFGIRLYRASNNTIENNNLINNNPDSLGLKVEGTGAHRGGIDMLEHATDGGPSTGNIVHFNNIVGNKVFGVSNTTSAVLDAERNWWGNVAGPDIDTNPYYWEEATLGDAVSNNVDYLPWLIQFDLVMDFDGWNIVSLPIIGEQPAEPSPPPAEVVAVYWFDSSTQKWGADPGQAGPLDAAYMKVTAPVSLSYPVSSEATFPSQKDMKVGWNFIGLAQLYDMQVYDALYDIYYATGQAELYGYSRVLSPSLNGESWSCTTDEPWEDMYPTKGYWVFMVNDAVLGGFTTTPIVEVEGGG